MSPTNKVPSVQTFVEARLITSAAGSRFYRLRSATFPEVARIDESYIQFVQPAVDQLIAGEIESIDIHCVPDKQDPLGWRIDVDHYRRAVMSQQTPVPTEAPLIDTKNITFTLSGPDHAFATALHKRLKQADPRFNRFQDTNAYIFETQLRLLRLQYPDLAGELPSNIPF